MKFTVAPSELQRALSYILPVISKQVSDPLFLNVLLEAGNKPHGFLRLRATDTVVSASTHLAAKVEQPGKLGVSAEKLHKIVSNFSEGAKLSVELEGASLRLKTKKSKTKLVTAPATLFPTFQSPSSPGGAFDPKVILSCLRWVKHSLLDDPNRPALSGVRIVVQDGYLTMSACDSRRLSHTGALLDDPTPNTEMFLSARPTGVLMKLCGWTKEGKVNISSAGRNAFFWNDAGLGYSSKLIGAKGIDPNTVRPQGNPTTLVSFDRLAMVEALHRVRAIEEREVRFVIVPKSITLRVGNESGEGEEIVNAGVSGDPIEVKLSGEFVAEALASMKTSEVYLYAWGLRQPLMLVPAGDEETYELLMAMA